MDVRTAGLGETAQSAMRAHTAEGSANADGALHVHTACWSDTARNATRAPTAVLLWIADSAVGANMGMSSANVESAKPPRDSCTRIATLLKGASW